MKFFLIFLFTLVWSHCPNNINSYNQDIDGLIVDLQNLPDLSDLEKFILGNSSLENNMYSLTRLPNPVLSSYFAYQIREIVKYLHCFNGNDNTITFSLDGSIKFLGGTEDSLLQLASLFDQITKDVLYSSRKVTLNPEKFSQTELIDYNFECIQGLKLNSHPQIRSTDKCERMIVFETDLKTHVFAAFKRLFRDLMS